MAEDKDKDKTPKGDINFEYNQSTSGLNMDNIPSQIDKGSLSYALNAAVENFDSNSITYQNEPGTEFCINFPNNYILIGKYLITEQAKQIYFLANPSTGDSEIGYMINNDCVYHTLINAKCLNFDVNFPIHKIVHKTSNCGTEIYWAQPNADRRFLNLDPTKIPYLPLPGSTPCNEILTPALDCNQLRVQPNYSIPNLFVKDVIIGGSLIAGTYQFAFQYSDAIGNPLTSYHSITNPTPIADPQFATVNFNYAVGKSIVLDISNIEVGGQFDYFNLAVIKTINAITSVELVGTFSIEGTDREITYSGQNVSNINLTVNDVFEKFPFYGPADDVTTAQDVLIWKGLSAPQRVSYQNIASQITLKWETYRIPPTENYADELNATNLRGYLRDEIYPFEVVFLLRSAKQTDGFHIPGRKLTAVETNAPDIFPSNPDYIEDPNEGPVPYWKIYNTATVIGTSSLYEPNNVNYKGPYQYGEFSYWESDATYPCDKLMWGELSEQKIRHHKFPDVEVSPIVECKPYTAGDKLEMGDIARFPIGVKVDTDQIKQLIFDSDLTTEQKADIVGYKIVRGDRTDNKSIVAKGMLRNVGKYTRDDQQFYYPNYPYNDLNPDPFLNATNNAYNGIAETWLIITSESGEYQYGDPNTNKIKTVPMVAGTTYEICSTIRPVFISGKANIGPSNYDVWYVEATGYNGFYLEWIDPFSEGNLPFTERTTFLKAGILLSTAGEHIFVRVAVGDEPDFSDCVSSIFPFVGCEQSNFRRSATTQLRTEIDYDGGVEPYPKIGRRFEMSCDEALPLDPIIKFPDLAYIQIFNSPETSFGQPFLGDVLKLESVMFGGGLAHFVEVKDNAKYRLLTKEAQQDALRSAGEVGNGDATNVFTAYQAYLEIYINGITRKNYAYSFNSIADYNHCVSVPDDQGVKQRRLDLARYLIPVIQDVNEVDINGVDVNINNYQRETSVYLRTDDAKPPFLFPHLSPNMIPTGVTDRSRFTIGCSSAGKLVCPPDSATTSTTSSSTTTTTTLYPKFCPPGTSCAEPAKKVDISVVSYYASLKNTFRQQWGQIYTYQTIDTGFQVDLSLPDQPTTVFGGDTFISRFAYKTKVPFFIDNRVGAPDDSEIFYDELGNIAYPVFWHSARSILEDFGVPELGTMTGIISYKAHNFDCPNCQTPPPPGANANRTFYDGYFYLFAYGIPNFYVESSYNIDLRQAFNDKEGDFWPHVSNSIPDDWVQESWVSIANDNTYYYNVSFSKQNTENLFTHIPNNFQFNECEFTYPFRAIFSDPQRSTTDTTVNNWLTYRAGAFFDFPQNYGALTSLDGIDKGQVLARFENKSLLYNALYTTQTNTNGQVYLGQSLFTHQPPPYDYTETDLGYMGSQHKFLLKIPQGQVSIDAKRGQVFLMNGSQVAKDLTAPGSGMNRFFTDHLAFEILRFFPDRQETDPVTGVITTFKGVNIDNNFNGIGLCGVYDSKFDRVIITKLDYIPLNKDIQYDSDLKEFFIEENKIRTQIFLSDRDNFCNKSWTVSYNLITNSWISFHSYLPNWYIGENNLFYSGKKGCCSEFDFAFIVGELIPNPPTTTTTSSSTTSTSSTTTTTTTKACNLVGGIVETMICDLIGTALITVPPVPPPCQRPTNMITDLFFTGYTMLIPPGAPIVTTGSSTAACDAAAFFIITPKDTFSLQSITAQYTALTVGNLIYAGEGTDCSTIPDGWYWTQEAASLGVVYHVVGGELVEIFGCVPTTTTTSTTCNLFIYQVDLYLCNTCAQTGGGSIGNSTPLTVGKWYFDPITGFKMLITSFITCGSGTGRNILDSSKKDFCAEVICPTTTTTTTL